MFYFFLPLTTFSVAQVSYTVGLISYITGGLINCLIYYDMSFCGMRCEDV